MERMIYQVLPTLSYGDAVSNHALALSRLMRSYGFKNEIFAENIHPKLSLFCRPVSDIYRRVRPFDIVIYHMSTGTELNYWFKDLRAKKVMIYHNVTPPNFFSGISAVAEDLTRRGREALRDMAGSVDMSIADSSYNAEELLDLGYDNVHVVPILLPFTDLYTPPDEKVVERMSDGRMNLLFVGRISPNKCQEDIIAVLHEYKRLHHTNCRLILAGGEAGMEIYGDMLRRYVKRLDLVDDVVFTGHIRFEELLAYYKTADAFVCMSRHEGFCVPLIESMFFDIPIFARRTSAIPYTLGDSGIQFDERDFTEIAGKIHTIMTDPKERRELIRSQREKLADYDNANVESQLVAIMADFLR